MTLTLTHAGTAGTLASPPPPLTAPEASSIGDAIAIAITLFSGATNSATVSDNLNGAYTAIGSPLQDISNGYWTQWFWVRVTTAGTPVISCTLGTAETGRLVYTRITGFTGTATLDSAMTGTYTVASGTAVNFALPNTAQNNEAVLLSWKSGSSLTATPSGWTNNVNNYSLIAATSGTSAAFNGTLAASSFVDAQAIGIYDSTGAPTPTITAVNGGSSIVEGATNVAVTGTNFVSGMSAAIAQPGGISVAQPFTESTSTAGTFNLTMEPGTGSQLAFTDATYTTSLTVTVSGSTSAPFAITLVPPAGLIFETLASVNSNSSYRITATPDLSIGDQLEASGNSAGTSAASTGLTLNNDGTFSFASGDTPVNFYVRRYNPTLGWSAYALQSVSGSSSSGFYRSRARARR